MVCTLLCGVWLQIGYSVYTFNAIYQIIKSFFSSLDYITQ